MSTYKQIEWKIFRQSVIELDGYKCRQCGRAENEVTLQVHHVEYINGLRAWEYPTNSCITLCKGCHAQTHGIIQPTFGWEYIGDDDLGDLIGTCENRGCSSKIRYSFTVFHQNWGTLEVGTVCCDNLTSSQNASNLIKIEGRKQRFLNSKRWIEIAGNHKLKQGLFQIEIFEIEDKYSIKINGIKSTKRYNSITDAKSKIFEIIENGQLMKSFIEKNIILTTKLNIKIKKK
jgi:hypothetical protein